MKYKMEDVFSEDYMNGFKTAIKMCQDIAQKQGLELSIPDLDRLTVEKEDND